MLKQVHLLLIYEHQRVVVVCDVSKKWFKKAAQTLYIYIRGMMDDCVVKSDVLCNSGHQHRVTLFWQSYGDPASPGDP